MNNNQMSGEGQQPAMTHSVTSRETYKIDPHKYKTRDTLIWSYFNKYFYTIFLLGVSATIQFDFFGFAYFFMFIFHAFAYYSLRIYDEPIDAMTKLRGNKRNIRGVFQILLIVVSSTAFTLVLVGSTINFLRQSQKDAINATSTLEVVQFSDICLQIIELLVPNYHSIYTFLQTLFLFIFSLIYFKTRAYEEQEALGRNQDSNRCVDRIENVENMRNYQVQNAVQLIKDYQFKTYIAVYSEMIVLALISSVSCTVLVIPYAIVFLVLCLIQAIGGRSKVLVKASQKLNLMLIALLLVDLPAKYLIKGGHFVTEDSTQRYYNQVIGLLSSLPTYIEFYLKILLFLIECQKIQYSFDFQGLYEQIKNHHSEKPEIQRLFRKRTSFTFRIFKPISIFMFSLLAIIFALLHPSIVFLIMLPLYIFGFFLNQNQYRGLSQMIVFIVAIFILASYIFHIVYLILPNDQQKEDYMIFIEKTLGLKRNFDLPNQLFPGKLDFLFCFILSFFSYYICKKDRSSIDGDLSNQRLLNMMKNGFEDDILTIPDDVSEVRSRISYKPSGLSHSTNIIDRPQFNGSKFRSIELPDVIIEDKKEEEEADEQDSLKGQKSVITAKENYIPLKKKPWNISRDETLRGKMRRAFFKIYVKVKLYFDRLLDLLTIHSSKFALFAMFVVSATRANIFNAILFLLFLFLALVSYKNVKKYWRLPIIFDSVILLAMYSLEVFKPKDLEKLDQTTIQFIGIVLSKDDQISATLDMYLPYLVLLVVLVITHYIINSQRYEEFIHNYQLIEEIEKSEKEQEEDNLIKDKPNKEVGLSDPLTKFIIKLSIYFLIVALFIECSLLPVSVLNLILMMLMITVLIKHLKSSSQLEMYQSSSGTLRTIKWISLVFLFLKYMFQFQDFAQDLAIKSNFDSQKYNEQLPLIEKLLGIEKSYVPIKLFSLALVMVISDLQLKFLQYKYLTNILKEENEEWNRLKFLDIKYNTNFWKALHYIQYSLTYISILSFLLFITVIIILQQQRENFWKEQYQMVGIVSSLTMVFIYGFQFIFMHMKTFNDVKFIEWLGVQKQNDEQIIIHEQIVPLFLILLVCCLQKQSQKCESLFTITVTSEEIDQEDQSPSLDSVPINLELVKLKSIYEFETPIRHCLKLRDHYFKLAIYLYGFLLFIVFSLAVMLYKLNITSIIYSVMVVLMVQNRYFPLRYNENSAVREQRLRIAFLMKMQILIISIVLTCQYFMSIGSAYLFDFESWKGKVTSKLCFVDSLECQQEWAFWLSLAQIPADYIVIDLWYLMVCYINLYFINGEIKLTADQLRSIPKLNDDKDFLSYTYTSSRITSILNYFIFSGFPYALISTLMIFAATFHGSGMADLISAVYLFLALYYIINFRRLYTKNSQMLSSLRFYNIIVLYAIIVFQSPLFICPSVDSFRGGFNFISNHKCAQLLTENLDDQKFVNTNSYLAIYIVFTQSLGLIKITKLQSDFIMIFILVEIQDYLFNHPFFQVYVLQHMKEEKETDGRLRAFMFVERGHLNVLWSFKAIKEEIKILHTRLLRINQTLRNQEHSKYLFFEEDFEINEKNPLLEESKSNSERFSNMDSFQSLTDSNQLLSQEDQENLILLKQIDRIVESHQVKIEDVALDLLSRPDTPVIPIKLFNSTFRDFLLKNEKVREMIRKGEFENKELRERFIEENLIEIVRKLQRHVHLKNRLDLYYKEGIGLNFAIQKGSDLYLKEGDFEFYYHLILNKQPQLEETKNQELEDQNQEDKEQFEVKESYEELFMIYDQFKEVEKKEASWLQKVNFYIRSYLWTNFINKHLFYSLTQYNKKPTSLYKMPFYRLLSNCILSQSLNISYLVLFLNFIINPNLISLMLPLSALFYALIDYPVPNIRYWKYLMIYMLITVALKFLYQLPIFCGSPPYSLFSIEGCQMAPVVPEVLFTRIDYIIGIHKFAGPSSYPRDQGILIGIAGDITVLLTLLILKNYLIKIGLWHYVRTRNNIYQSPAFKCKVEELTELERINIIKRENFKLYEYEQAKLPEKIKIRAQQLMKYTKNFVLKLMPQYMQPLQKNLDLRTQKELNYIPHNSKRVKPGKDFFSASFFSLLMIFVYNLFWYKNVIGQTQSVVVSSANLQRFSTGQVLILFLVLVLMMAERMLYRVRYFDQHSTLVNSGIGKHQLTIKICLHIIVVLFVHFYLVSIIQKHNLLTIDRKFPLIISYILWVYYFVSSANQIRHGYPQAPFKPPFTRDTSFFKVWGFRIYKAVPFLWEMKVIIDWTVTATCLDLYQWFKIDDAFNYLYQNQFQINDRQSRPEFQQRRWYEKFFQGFCFAFGLILVILAPILLFSGINPIMVKNPVLSGQLSMFFELNSNGNTYSILQTQAFHIRQLNDSDIDSLSKLFNPVNVQFAASDMQKMQFSPYSEREWSISPPSLQKFIDDFEQIKNQKHAFFEIKTLWNFKRSNPIGNEATQAETKIRMNITKLQPIIDLLADKQKSSPRQDAYLNQTESTDNKGSIFVANLFPKILKLGSTQQASLLEVQPVSDMDQLSSAMLTLNRVNNQELYWTYELIDADKQGIFDSKDSDRDKNLMLLVYNEEVIGSFFGAAFQFSVVGLYATIVIAIGRFIRLIFDRISQRVIYEEMNDTEQLFEICEGIFIAQLEGDLIREKRLYEMMIRLYRSPETLIKMTGKRLQYKESFANQEQKDKQKPQSLLN